MRKAPWHKITKRKSSAQTCHLLLRKLSQSKVREQPFAASPRSKSTAKRFYEAELLVNRHSRDVLIDANGTVVEVEEQVPAESLSPQVREGLQAKTGKGKLVKVDTLTKKGKLVGYEAQVLTNGKKSEVQVGPDGKSLAHEE